MAETDNFDAVGHIIGTCEAMCPESEITLRERENLLHPLEEALILKDGRKKANPRKTVKEFRRPAAGREVTKPCDLRPPSVLKMTVNYLLGEVAMETGHQWNVVYDFIFDRLRAVRQDMVIQNIGGENAIEILEKITRFHIYAGYRLCDTTMEIFDPKINNQHTQECIKRLLSLYPKVNGHHSHQEEFESLYMMFNLGQTEALMHYFDLSADVRRLPLVKLAYEMNIAYILRNFVRVLRLSSRQEMKNSPLNICAFHRHKPTLYSECFRLMCWGFHSKMSNYPVKKLTELLLLKDTEHCIQLCKQHGLQVKENDTILFLKSSYQPPEKLENSSSRDLDRLLQLNTLPELFLGDKD